MSAAREQGNGPGTLLDELAMLAGKLIWTFKWTVGWALCAVAVPVENAAACTAAAALVVVAAGTWWRPLWLIAPGIGDVLAWRRRGKIRRGNLLLRNIGLVSTTDTKRYAIQTYKWSKGKKSLTVVFEAPSYRVNMAKVRDAAEAGLPVLRAVETESAEVAPGTYAVTWYREPRPSVLATPIPFPRQLAESGEPLSGLVIGRREDGSELRHPAVGVHTLLVGESGAGKGSVLWSFVLGLLPHVRRGTVQVFGVDLKGGVELSMGRSAFVQIATNGSEALLVLEAVAERMRARLDFMRASAIRSHEATPGQPHITLVFDEIGALKLLLDRRDYETANGLLKEILTQGRAAGVTVFAALQDPRKEALDSRDLFTRKLALRFPNAEYTRLFLGAAPWDAGAHCERISPAMPGCGYSVADGSREPAYFRAFNVTDDLITKLT